MNPIQFLTSIWRDQGSSGHVCVSTKEDASQKSSPWRDYSFPLDDSLEENLSDWLKKHSSKDLYFSPLLFSSPRRSKQYAQPSLYLWSDIDEGDPHRCLPSILWETSPGRHSGLWRIPKPLKAEEAAEASKKIARYIGGDPSGWDTTQVLRIPGCPNNKYPSKPLVTLKHFTPTQLLRTIPEDTLEKWRPAIPRKLLRIIEGPAEVGKRSDMLWYLEHELCDLGIPLKDTIEILRASDWNKYRGRADEEERFQVEVDKIRQDRQEKDVETREDPLVLRVETYSELMSSMAGTPGWMVRDWWMRGSHGIIAGEPKSFKSTLNLDLLFSIASDRPFLGQFPVEHGGPVVVVQNENSDWMQRDRLEKVALSRGEVGNVKTSAGRSMRIEWARNLPMFFVNQQGFTLDDAANKAALEELIQRYRPVALVLDPLYLMFSGDVNSAKELYPVLNWCLYLKQEYKCSVMLIHHYNKSNAEGRRGGQRMLGSTTLHGWIESAWYIQAQEPADGKALVTIDREFRGAGLYPKQDLELDIGEYGDPRYVIGLRDHKSTVEDFEQQIIDALATSTEPLSKSSLSRKLGLSRRQIDKAVEVMVSKGYLILKGERYFLGDLSKC